MREAGFEDFDKFVKTHQDSLVRFVHKLISDEQVAEDVVQDVFENVYLDPSILNDSHPLESLKRIARYKLSNLIRRQNSLKRSGGTYNHGYEDFLSKKLDSEGYLNEELDIAEILGPGNRIVPVHDYPHSLVYVDELSIQLQDVISSMPFDMRRIIELSVQGHDLRAIATQTGMYKPECERLLNEGRAHIASAAGIDAGKTCRQCQTFMRSDWFDGDDPTCIKCRKRPNKPYRLSDHPQRIKSQPHVRQYHHFECQHPNCARLITARGYCSAHYQRNRNGKPMDVPIRDSRHRGTDYCQHHNCHKIHFSNGWCRTHYERHIKGSDMNAPHIIPTSSICTYPGCEQPYYNGGLCSVHYDRKQQGKNMAAPILKGRSAPRICTHPGCDRVYLSNGFCKLHYDRNRRKTDMDAPVRQKGISRTCTYPGCGRPHTGKGFCSGHLRRYKMGASMDLSISLRGKTRRDGVKS